MNIAQAVIPTGFGTFEWRDDISPGPGFLAWELTRSLWPNGHAAAAKPEFTRARPEKAQPSQPTLLFDPDTEENKDVIERLLRVLRRAGRAGDKLAFSIVFEQLALERSAYRRTLRILAWLCDTHLVQRTGSNHAALYWAD